MHLGGRVASEVSTAKNIGAAGAAVLGAALAAMPSPLLYEWINLDTNGLTAAGMVPIAAAIGGGNAPHLEEVGVGSNELGAEGARALGAALATCPKLKTINVDSNQLGDEGVAALAEALANCPTLQNLRFSRNDIGAAGFEALAAHVSRWPELRRLGVGRNPGPSDALGRALAAALPSLPHVEVLDLEGSGLGATTRLLLRAAKGALGRPQGLYVGS